MKFKLDENMPYDFIEYLNALGHDVHSVQQEGLSGSADPNVMDFAIREQRILITHVTHHIMICPFF